MRTRQVVAALALAIVTILFAQGAAQAGGYHYYHDAYGRSGGGYAGGDHSYRYRFGQQGPRAYGYGHSPPRYGLDYPSRYGNGGYRRYDRPGIHSRQYGNRRGVFGAGGLHVIIPY